MANLHATSLRSEKLGRNFLKNSRVLKTPLIDRIALKAGQEAQFAYDIQFLCRIVSLPLNSN